MKKLCAEVVSATSSEDFLVFGQPLQVTVYRMLRHDMKAQKTATKTQMYFQH